MAWVPVNQTLILQPMGKVHGSLLRCDFTLLSWDCNQNGLRDQEQPDISDFGSQKSADMDRSLRHLIL